jgi:predicted phage replisome organizer
VLFYLKLMLEAVDHEGALRFSEEVPYTESMLASVTGTGIEVVRSSLRLFTELGMVKVLEDQTLYIPEVAKLLDSETYAAGRQRKLREKKEGGDNVAPPSHECRQDIEKETDTEIEIDTDTEKKRKNSTAPDGAVCRTADVRRIMEAWNALGLQQVVKVTGSSKRGTMLRARVQEYGTEGVLEAIGKIRQSAFLQGQNEKGWVITFDWFVKPNNFLKVLEGNYDKDYRKDGK